jgi:sugar O-acyltransferase (sialic acid O-acetyltransferase NeuD family)
MKVVILGAGGLAREVYWVFCAASKAEDEIEVLGFIDEDSANWGKQLCGIPVLGDFNWFESASDEIKVICAVGSPAGRLSLVKKSEQYGLSFCSIIHPGVMTSKYIEIGLGIVITAGCIITTQVKIGNHAFLNLDTTVGHDVVIKDFVNVSPGCHISGNVILKQGVDLGTGAVIIPGITVGKWATIGAGAVVTKDIPDNAVAVGVPAKVIKYR